MAENNVMMCHECAAKKITHEFQDATYGKWMRVHNVNEKTGTRTCTYDAGECGTTFIRIIIWKFRFFFLIIHLEVSQ